MPAIFIPDADFDEDWARSNDAKDLAEDYAETGLQHAKANAPVRTGEYRNSLTADVVMTETGWAGRVVSDDPKTPYLEFGTSDTPAFATLRRALEATGAQRRRTP